MQDYSLPELFTNGERRLTMRLRTLITLRWGAIGGQLVALAMASQVFMLQLPLLACLLTVGMLIVANLMSISLFPATRRLTEAEARGVMMFDLLQLAALIMLTGGLTNPFALLLLAPVTMSATALGLSSTLLLGMAAVISITLMSWFNVPILLPDGQELTVPPLLEFGFWVAIVVGLVFLSIYARRLASENRAMAEALLATQMALAREQKLTDLGGVVAAAAHELGTPLATIKLVSAELIDELDDHPDALDDVKLIRDQADRCRDILRSMGRAGKDDRQLQQTTLGALLREAAEPHAERGKAIHFTLTPADGTPEAEPMVLRRAEIIHGLRNLIQNAVDFAKDTVWIDAHWDQRVLSLRIVDNGPGYPPQVLARIGDPFLRARSSDHDLAQRPEYEGMGLGLFIAKTLLERSGASLAFANASDPFLNTNERPTRCGAMVTAIWPMVMISPPHDLTHAPNEPFRQ